MSDSKTTVSLEIRIPLHELVDYVRQGNKLWGGGAEVTYSKYTNAYNVIHTTEEGFPYFSAFSDPRDAVWHYLSRVGGSVNVTVEPYEAPRPNVRQVPPALNHFD